MDSHHLAFTDEQNGGGEPYTKPMRAGRSKRPSSRRKRVRWADEERLHTPLIGAVLIFNGTFLLVGLLARWGWWNPAEWRSSSPTSLEHDMIELRDLTPLPARPHAVREWMAMRRDVTPSNTSALQSFSVDVPLLGQGGSVIGGGTVDGFNGVSTTVSGAAASGCKTTLAVNTFANSFATPFVGNYTPPSCLADSNTVIMNLTVQSKGNQFDRLAIVYLGDTEIFRTSTEEPTSQGIAYTYMKDVSHLMALWKQPQKVIFDLPNSINANITGNYSTALTASFFSAPQAVTPADTIIPVSARQANNSKPSVFTIPGQVASNAITDFPRNANRAIFSVSATGQGNEEFWWSNVLQSDTLTYNTSGATLLGYSPFREVQVLIDGQLAGVQWPFPVIFTGGVVPSFWSPMVGIDAFDLKEGEIDISPWLGVLCDGQSHNFTMNVVGLNDTGGTNAVLSQNVNSDWQITGKIFIWQDSDANAITTGAQPTVMGTDPTIAVSQSLTQNSTGANDTLKYTTSVQRGFGVSGSITTSSGTVSISWSQQLTHTDNSTLGNGGNNQINYINTTGTDTSTHGSNTTAGFTNQYSYPFIANVTSQVLANGTTLLDATLQRTKQFNRSTPGAVYPTGLQLFAALSSTADLVSKLSGTSFATTQNGAATLLIAADGSATGGSTSFGTQSQTMRFGAVSTGNTTKGWMGDEPDMELYFRDVSVNSSGSVLGDTERLAGQNVVEDRPAATSSEGAVGAVMNAVLVRTGVGVVDARLGVGMV